MTYRIINIISVFVILIWGVLTYLAVIPWWSIFFLVLLYFILLITISTNVQWDVFIKGYHSNPNFPEKSVALSFDDGPSEHTYEILDILDRYNTKAIFFCIGENIERFPDIFREIIKRGHIVGNHTYSHTRRIGFLSSATWENEILKCDEVAKKTAGVNLKLFRPPFGIINPKTKRALNRTGHKVIGWNVRPYDAITSSPEVVIRRITRNLNRGDLILLHDNKNKTTAILEQLLVILKQRNFSTVRADKLFDINAYS